MNYEQQNWVTGNRITAEKLNHMEEGIESANSGSSDLFYVQFSWDSQHNAFVIDKSLEELAMARTEHKCILGSLNGRIFTFIESPVSFTNTYVSVNTGVMQTLELELDDDDQPTGYWISQTNTWQTTQQLS